MLTFIYSSLTTNKKWTNLYIILGSFEFTLVVNIINNIKIESRSENRHDNVNNPNPLCYNSLPPDKKDKSPDLLFPCVPLDKLEQGHSSDPKSAWNLEKIITAVQKLTFTNNSLCLDACFCDSCTLVYCVWTMSPGPWHGPTHPIFAYVRHTNRYYLRHY